MHYITLDTNTWIYLANGTEPVKILSYIKQEIDKGNITILIPEIVTKEWETHKDKTVLQGGKKHFKEVTDALNKILKLLGDKGERNTISFLLNEEDDKNYFKDFLDDFNKKKEEVESAIKDNIELIDNIFKNNSTIIPVSDDVVKKAASYALEKKAPFGNKNSFADALILFSFFEFVEKKSIEGAYFITYNTDDFCERKEGKKHLHSDLKEDFELTKSRFYTIVGEAINTIEKNIVTQEELERIKEMQDEWDEDIEFCQVCQENNSRLNDVHFSNYDLEDERKGLIYDIDQLQIDFEDDIKYNPEQYMSKIEVGHCSWCDSEHFRCVDCGTVNAIWEGEYNSRKECEGGCGLNYFIKRRFDRNDNLEVEYMIPKDTITCQKCSQEFDDNGYHTDVCEDCESEYGYD